MAHGSSSRSETRFKAWITVDIPCMQMLMLDLFDNVSEPLVERKPFTRFIQKDPLLIKQDKPAIEKKIKNLMDGIGILPRGRIFSAFNREHMEEAMKAVQLLMRLKEGELHVALAYFRDKLNEEMFVYVTSVMMTHQPNFHAITLPPVEEVMPEKFIPREAIIQARTAQKRAPTSKEPIVIDVDFTGNDLDPEHRLAYWREDIGLNAHHWHWHVIYPYTWVPELGTKKDRKGELFYYMHQQLIARYDCERLSHNFTRVKPLHNWSEPITEGYSPHLRKEISGVVYAFRPANMVMQDLPHVTVDRIRTWYTRIIRDIHLGYFTKDDGTKVPLDNEKGVEIIGDAVESTLMTVNSTYYGNLHNEGHNAIARIHDPDERYKEEIGVMGDITTAMRDPVFYRWHKFIDNIFHEHKATLKPYTKEELTFDGIVINTFKVRGRTSSRSNSLKTFWEERTIELDKGVAFNSTVPVSVRVRHLQHEPFKWILEVENTGRSNKQGTVRIFMAPILNETRQKFSPNEQRLLMIEMDKFEYTFKPGKKETHRRSFQSNVTVPTLQSFGELINKSEETNSQEIKSFCSCGLPDHLLLPRGKQEGMPFLIFAMITNALDDRVEGETQECKDAASYCGVLNEKYPDSKPMGFPFDRVINTSDWSTFKTNNMAFNEISIRFSERVTIAESASEVTLTE